jgi:lipopolysaccharide transport system ATP-binding protein
MSSELQVNPMRAPVIRVEKVSKRYWIDRPQDRATHLREALTNLIREPFKRFSRPWRKSSRPEEFWAIRDVSFEVERGEVLGIIGSNGAGKSTLLRIISRITAPTAGRAGVRGRIGSLLEVGTGFHPELTGRQNIYLNGTILGMRKREIDRKFDEIVDFAGVDAFIETPVKRYSSGMYVRLAFAVAAHLETEIMLVDEVLAVGDADFQRKCLGKISDVARSGRTVLFVSHNMAAVQRLCTSAMWLERGRIADAGNPRTVASAYLTDAKRSAFAAGKLTGASQLLAADVKDTSGMALSGVFSTEPFVVHLRYVLPEDSPGTRVGIGVLSAEGTPLFTSNAIDAALEVPNRAGEYEARVTVPGNVLLAGQFQLAVCLWNERAILDLQEPALSFTVHPGPSPLYMHGSERKGFVNIPCRWEIQGVSAPKATMARTEP